MIFQQRRTSASYATAPSSEREEESGERAANNGRQPKHPINLTGPDLKPRGVLNSLTPNADAGATLTLRYTHGKGSHAVRYCRAIREQAASREGVCTVRWFRIVGRGQEGTVMCEPRKTKPREFHPVLPSLSPLLSSPLLHRPSLLPLRLTSF
jgi:hypothetical protein